MAIVSTNAMQSGLQGYQHASSQLQQASAQLAQGQRQNMNFTASVIDLQSAGLEAQASAEVMQRADSMVGTIIDIFV